ncbi:MAG: hypothetical protein C1943_14435 [Halochromatium sp.]|nr:hypothetical protein [Halochromatium sp.]
MLTRKRLSHGAAADITDTDEEQTLEIGLRQRQEGLGKWRWVILDLMVSRWCQLEVMLITK